MKNKLTLLIFGEIEFREDEEYLKFQFRLMYALLLMAAFFSGAFILAEWLGLNTLPHAQLIVIKIYFAYSLLLSSALRGRKHRFLAIAWLFAIASFLSFLSTLLLVPEDELRILWFYLNLSIVYILLGQISGIVITILSIVCIFFANQHLLIPYSTNALTTVILSLSFTSAFFYAYTSRSISFFRRMTESNSLLRELATRDPLTDVLNARTYYEVCDRLISLALRTGDSFSVLFIDLDHFKSINDQYGHEAGDATLKEVAACLSRHTRQSDVLGRIGGEEFSKFLPNTDLTMAMLLAEKLREDIEKLTPTIDGKHIRITASFGVASNQQHHQSITDIQREADQAMYRAKQQGRNRVINFEQLYESVEIKS
ncbi:MAG: GGDEF domain-containing protein [Methylococcaceae bacterium]|nr:GGDEF domain-containing protein [Methylococcaceae bacterium]